MGRIGLGVRSTINVAYSDSIELAHGNTSGDNQGVTKIAIFLQNLAGGGAERMMLHLASGLAQRGIAVDLVVVRAEGEYIPAIPNNVRLVNLRLRRTLLSIPSMVRYLQKERPAAVLSALVHVNIAAVLAARLSGRSQRIVVSERNTISIDSMTTPTLGVRIAHWLVPWLYPRADAIVAVSAGVAEDLASFCGMALERITVINNPVVTPNLAALAQEAVDHPWLATTGPPVILGVGRLAFQKNFQILIEAFARVLSVRPARLIILGEGPQRPELEAQIRRLQLFDSVALPGFVSNPYSYMSRASVYVLSSRWEGSPNALVEAMACGTPVVATDCRSGPAEILAGGQYGHLVPVADANALAKAIIETLENPASDAILRQRAADFNLEHAVDQYLEVLLA